MSNKKIDKKKEQLKEIKNQIKELKKEVKETKEDAKPYFTSIKSLEQAETKKVKLEEEIMELQASDK